MNSDFEIGKRAICRASCMAALATVGLSLLPQSQAGAAPYNEWYTYVADKVDNEPPYVASGSDPFYKGVCVIPFATSGQNITFDYSLWDEGNPTTHTSMYTAQYTTALIPGNGAGGAGSSESWRTASIIAQYNASAVGIYAGVNPFGSNSNIYLRVRNFRANDPAVFYAGPTALTYSNVTDDEYRTDFPSTADQNNSNPQPGFRGLSTPYNNGSFSRIYLSLRGPNGLYWDGTNWSHKQVNLSCTKSVVNPSTGQVDWRKHGIFPANMTIPQGTYEVSTMAVQGFSNVGPGRMSTLQFTVDSFAPNSPALTTPAPNNTYTSFGNLSGTATDNGGGSGLKQVNIRLVHQPTGESWNWATGAWTSAAVTKDANISGSNWSISGGPSVDDQRMGQYTVTIQAVDRANNTTSANANFTLADGVAPNAATLVVPGNNSVVSTLTSLSGACSDNPGGTGIQRVGLQLVYNGLPGAPVTEYFRWLTNNWGTTAGAEDQALHSTLNGARTAWSTSYVPTGASLRNGTYTLTMRSFDYADNRTVVTATFRVDKNFPAAPNLTTPTPNTTVTSLSSLVGTCGDNSASTGGTGILKVRAQLVYRGNSQPEYWNWVTSSWNTNQTLTDNYVRATLINNGFGWSIASGLPSGSALRSGQYDLQVFAYDLAKNMSPKVSSFSINNSNVVSPPALIIAPPPDEDDETP